MSSTYLHQLLTLGIHPLQLPSGELAKRISSPEPFFMLDIQPDTTPGKSADSPPTPDEDFNVAFYYAIDNSSRSFHLTHYVATLYSDDGEISLCRTFPIINQPAVPTIREAKNLLQGRSVLKRYYAGTPAEYDVWLRIDFHRKDSTNEYKIEHYREIHWRILKDVLAMYPIVEMEDPTLAKIITRALQTGELIELSVREGSVAVSRKIVGYDPRSPLLKFLAPRKHTATIAIDQLKQETLWMTL